MINLIHGVAVGAVALVVTLGSALPGAAPAHSAVHEAAVRTESPSAARTYYAACNSRAHPGSQNWYGPNRSTRRAAEADADAHSRATGHSRGVVGVLTRGQ